MASLMLGAQAHGIDDVLTRSQLMRLDSVPPARSTAKADTVRRSFDELLTAMGVQAPISLKVVSGPVVAETLLGQVVLANESLADVPEGARLFILAHEIGHVVSHDWLDMCQLYQRWVPGEVTPASTNPVAELLGRAASALAYRQEQAADAYAIRHLRQLGWSDDDAVTALLVLGSGHLADTATHPSSRRRMAEIRGVQDYTADPDR
jgi:hypothetical protein